MGELVRQQNLDMYDVACSVVCVIGCCLLFGVGCMIVNIVIGVVESLRITIIRKCQKQGEGRGRSNII